MQIKLSRPKAPRSPHLTFRIKIFLFAISRTGSFQSERRFDQAKVSTEAATDFPIKNTGKKRALSQALRSIPAILTSLSLLV